ncbi:helicase [Burkholderia sp. Ac-20344]|uniref:helicase n=1 Tax=Burkholderia sp. Ac-20344 TaxID=2703890 RepID=UPI001ECD0F77|nr:helicase [Burkholderia sp. Ac-20344]
MLTLVLLVGGYVTVDRTCKVDPVCRGSTDSVATAPNAGPYASNDPVLPVLPAPVYPFHSTDGTRVTPARPSNPDAGESAGRTVIAQAAPPIRAPDRLHAGTVRVTDGKGNHASGHRAHAARRVRLHTAHTRRTTTGNTQIAQLYRGH